jgi:cytochrome b
MIFSLALQALSGLCSDDQILFKGPLTLYLNESQIEWASFYHSEVGQPLLIALIATHVFAVLFYKYKLQHDLIKSMLSGYKSSDSVVSASIDNLKSRLLALGCFSLIVFLLFYFLPVQ